MEQAPMTDEQKAVEQVATPRVQRWTGHVEASDQGGFVAYGDYLRLERELTAANAEIDRRKGDASTRLHNICEGLTRDKQDSPYSAESWDELIAENDRLRKDASRIDKLEALFKANGKFWPLVAIQTMPDSASVMAVNKHHGDEAGLVTRKTLREAVDAIDTPKRKPVAAESLVSAAPPEGMVEVFLREFDELLERARLGERSFFLKPSEVKAFHERIRSLAARPVAAPPAERAAIIEEANQDAAALCEIAVAAAWRQFVTRATGICRARATGHRYAARFQCGGHTADDKRRLADELDQVAAAIRALSAAPNKAGEQKPVHSAIATSGAPDRASSDSGIALRDYFAAHAPVEVPSWFEHAEPPKDLPPMPDYMQLDEAHQAEARDWIKDGCWDLPEELQWFSDKVKAHRNARLDWDMENAAQRYMQWRYAYAEAMLRARATAPGGGQDAPTAQEPNETL